MSKSGTRARTASLRVLSPSTVPVGAACVRRPGLTLQRPQGFDPLDAAFCRFRTSRVCFAPVRPWGFPLQGLYFLRIAATSRPLHASLTLERGLRTRAIPAFEALIPSGSRHPAIVLRRRRAGALLGFPPFQGLSFRSPRPFGRAPPRASPPSPLAERERLPPGATSRKAGWAVPNPRPS